jgi:hypothetical protein
MPKEHHCKLVYKDAYNLAVNPGPKEIVFRLNSLYDPDYTSTGKQPYYYDSLAGIYDRYRVFKTDYVIYCSSSQSS